MKPRQQVSRAALELIRTFEGFRETAAQLPDGRWTIGHGHTKTARPGARVTLDDARDLLLYDLIEVTKALQASVFTPLSQNQFDALASFVFNIGAEGFGGSAVLRRLNEGELTKAAYAMELWRKAEIGGEIIVVDALVRRRAAEKTLFLTPADGFVAAPTPLVRPRLDEDARDHAPAETPVEVVASADGDQLTATRAEPPLIPQPVEDAGPSLADYAGPTFQPSDDDGAAAGGEAPILAPAEEVEDAPPSLAQARAPEPAAYDGAPLYVPSVEDESPLPPSPEAVAEVEAGGTPEPTVEDQVAAYSEEDEADAAEAAATQAAAPTEAAQPLATPADVRTFDATKPIEPQNRRRTLVLASILGVVGAGLFVVGVVAVYRGKYENSGSTGLALVVGVAGLMCLAAVAYILLDQLGARED